MSEIKVGDFLKDIKFPSQNIFSDIIASEKSRLNDSFKDINKNRELLAAKQQAKEQREIQLNQMIQQIVENTAYLPEMVGLVRKNNEVNEEMLALFQEMTEVMKAQTPEEAEGIIKNVVTKAMETNDALDAASGLMNYGKLLLKLMFPEG
ncbi:hypothetical protein [Metabacillus dongyingensis]|uniref:hypothetical protein n=1 Tax=Metabacillus dongyingensis TaxID=2874282 RepID=UPI001CBC18AB|nr:hypothetical protein [Metabacillus dongyingensis]UAL53501.1 hypothetical protein K8L98_06865 [Metabacillus dongyingensis]